MPLGPSARSILADVFKTIKIRITFIIIATMIFSIRNSALNESKVVKLPGPAMSGKARGNIDAVEISVSSCLYKVIPKIISRAIKNKINAPATANELTPIPISDKMFCPKNKNKIKMTPAMMDAFSLCI